MINHIVLIRWKEGIGRPQIDRILADAQSLAAIAGVKGLRIQRNLGVARVEYGRGISDVMTITLEDGAALAKFGPDPIHRKFGAAFMPLVQEITILDLED